MTGESVAARARRGLGRTFQVSALAPHIPRSEWDGDTLEEAPYDVAKIRRLFDGFVQASVFAIEQRDPTTSGHSFRVAELCLTLAGQLPQPSKMSWSSHIISDGTEGRVGASSACSLVPQT